MKANKLKPFPFIKQVGFMECGTTSLAMIFKYYGYYDVRNFLSKKSEVNTEGIDLYTISGLAEGFGFETNGFQLNFENLGKLHLPCIAHYNGNHFVVVYKVNAKQVWIADPAVGKYTLTREEFEAKWNGIVLEVRPTNEIFKHTELAELAEANLTKRKTLFSKFYWSSLLPTKGIVFQILLATLFLQLLGLALPFFTQTIIDQVLVNANIKLLYAILIGMLVLLTSQVMLTYGRNMLITQFKSTFELNFFSKFFNHFLQLTQTFYDNHKREDFINRFQVNLKIRNALRPSILEGVIDFAFIMTYLLALLAYNVQLGLIIVLFTLFYTVLTVSFSPKLRHLENKIFTENQKTMGQFLDTLLGIQSVRLLGIEKLRYWQWKNQYTSALNKVMDTEKNYIQLTTLLSSLKFTCQIAIYWYGAYLSFNGVITIGQYIAFITIFTTIINSLSRITQLWFLFTEMSVNLSRMNDVFIEETIDYSPLNKVSISGPIGIDIRQVNFKYSSRNKDYTLKNINLEIQPGTFLGIVGRNGSGKTTLIKLLSNLYDHYEGEICMNDVSLKNILPAQLRKKVAVIPQDIFLFDATIKENILYGNPNATDEEVIEAAQMADIHDFIKTLYLGYNQKIGVNGANLSGGQQLKIAFARLFVSNPEVVILDEASSALDVETEHRIMQNVFRKFKGKTIISIAHRLHTLQHADYIAVLEKGELAEYGSHNVLMDKQGIYSQFINTYINF
ncbi:peptidase domain-containing ABC transporter [Flammeovirgaceae bacterium SG7u.111]|nr:peptidase domain-containing ABC transporter [Flammeovirgaceae bacterium SG7u.132]WPO35006.1 peptidase domain-containing ABC transporter [Flammeovirgaceae bacterium SG7u.111]